MLRTHEAGTLRAEHSGQTVTLTGWVARRRDHGGVVFIDLRDSSGLVQVVFRDESVAEKAHRLRAEYCVTVTGVVEVRPEGSENPNLSSGEIEINDGYPTTTLKVRNTGDRPIQVGSHYHFFEVNRALDFDRAKALGHRLDIPAGTAVRGVVKRARFMGGESLVEFDMAFGGPRFKVTVPAVFLPKAGTAMWLTIRRDKCFIFPVD